MATTAEPKTATVVKDGLHFAEAPTAGPDGRLYLSDFYAHEVIAVDTTTWRHETIAEVPHQPSGLGFLPDGSLLVVSMTDRRLLRRTTDGALVEHADLSGIARGAANDMLVDAEGRAWIGDFGFDFYDLLEREPEADPLFGPGANPPTASITLVRPDGGVGLAAEGLRFPNGTVRLSDGRIVAAETVGACLTAFVIGDDGRLIDRTVLADLSAAGPEGDAVLPDGICVDPQDGIWVSDPTHSRAVHVLDGRVVDEVRTTQPCFAVGLVGDQLVLCTAESSNPNIAGPRATGRLEVHRLPPARPRAGR